MASYVTFVFFLSALFVIFYYEFVQDKTDIPLIGITVLLSSNVISDYLSLFVVRRWLFIARDKPLFAMFTGALVGILIVVSAVSAQILLWDILKLHFTSEYITHFYPQFLIDFWTSILLLTPYISSKPVVLSAFMVHLWSKAGQP
jgi:hypothetical protein